jgi:hypothetical protein
MNILDAILGRTPQLEEIEEELGKPDTAESYDLNLHVERCARRWLFSYRASKSNSAQLAQLRLILLIFAASLFVIQPPIAKWIVEHFFN